MHPPPSRAVSPSTWRERRQEPRFPYRLSVTLASAPDRPRLVTRDVSFRGLFLEGAHAPVRHLVRLEVVLPTTTEVLVLHGMVVRNLREEGDASGPGMAVELYALDRETRAKWWSLVRHARDQDDRDAPSGVQQRRPG